MRNVRKIGRRTWLARASGGAIAVDPESSGRSPLSSIDRLRARLRRAIARVIREDVAPIARAIVLGEEDLVPEDDEAFRRSGLTHLLAVSGSHVALVVGSIVVGLRAVLLRCTWLAPCGIAAWSSRTGDAPPSSRALRGPHHTSIS